MKKSAFFFVLGQYMRARWKGPAVVAFFAAIFAVVFYLYRVPAEAVGYAALLCAVFGVLLALADFIRFYKKGIGCLNASKRTSRSAWTACRRRSPFWSRITGSWLRPFTAIKTSL